VILEQTLQTFLQLVALGFGVPEKEEQKEESLQKRDNSPK
jgi:hypothetical protein